MYSIPYLPTLSSESLTAAIFELENSSPEFISHNNWKELFPYTPDVCFRMAHNGNCLFIRFDVQEKYTMAKIAEDNGKVCTDSCVEFFISLDDTGYYNFEFNCIGKVLSGFRKERPDAVYGDKTIMDSIKRFSSLGNNVFNETTGDNRWTLIVAIPAVAFFKHNIHSFQGLKVKANLYKCGDHLTEPHFLSWNPIDTDKPNFHVPQFFREIEFAKGEEVGSR